MSQTRPDNRILVVGAGYVGQRFLARQEPGAAVGLNRSPVDSTQTVEEHNLDVGGPLPVALQKPYKVLYTVAPAGPPPDDRLEHLLNELHPPPECLVYISTTGVYGDHGGATVDEATPVKPQSVRAKARVFAETLAREWGDRHHVRVVILRVPAIYGPTRLGHHSIRSRQPVIAEDEIGPGNRIHVDDLVTCCEAALSDNTPPGIYNVGDGDHRSSTWFKNELARQLNLPAPTAIGMDEAVRVFSPMALSFLRESRIVDTQKMRDVLGVTPRYPNAEDGIRASLEEEPD